MKHFNEYKQLNLAELSKEILAQWEKEDLFHQSIETREGCPSFLFFEGPPSANGMPGIHHVMARTIKDTFCRFKTMQGYYNASRQTAAGNCGMGRGSRAGGVRCAFFLPAQGILLLYLPRTHPRSVRGEPELFLPV